MPPKKAASFEMADPEQPSIEEKKPSKKGGKPTEKLKLDDVASEPTGAAVTRKPSTQPSTRPSTMEMVKEALKALDTRKGSSAQAIRRYILENYPSMDQIRLKYMLRRALAKGLEGGVLVRPPNSTANGAQGRFRLAARGKAKEPKGTENADPNVEKPKTKTKAKGTASEKPKPVAKKPKDKDSGTTEALASKVASAKKPKKAAVAKGPKEPKEAVPTSKVGTGSKTRKAKSPAKPLEGSGGPAKNPGKRGKSAK